MTSGGRSVSIDRLRTKAMEFSVFIRSHIVIRLIVMTSGFTSSDRSFGTTYIEGASGEKVEKNIWI
jgi:hypothetical protein